MQQRIDAYFNDPARRAQLIAAISRLVAVKSVREDAAPGQPYGPGPAAALAEGVALAREMGFQAENLENYVATADLNDKDTALHILGHLDVVGEGKGWDTDPYTCVEKDGMLYGRGVSDDKGPVVCALMAMQAIRDLEIPLQHNVKLIMGGDEESGSSDLEWYYANHPYAPYTFTPDANFPLINIEKGHYRPDFGKNWASENVLPRVTELQGGFRTNVVPPEASCVIAGLAAEDFAGHARQVQEETGAVFTLTDTAGGLAIHCAGRNAHAASPDDGLNAISALLTLLARLPLADCESTRTLNAMHTLFPFGDNRGKALGIGQEDEESGPLTLNLALMTLTDTGFTGKFDVRFPLCANEENCKNACEASFACYGIAVTGDAGMVPPHHVPADSPLVRTLLDCYQVYTGDTDAKPLAIGGGTYVHDIPGGVAFGCEFPGFDPRMHAANEQASVEQLLTSCKIFTMAIARLCG